MGTEDTEQAFDGGDPVKVAAAELSEGRKWRDAAVAREAADRPQRQKSQAEVEQAVWARDTFRNTVAAEVQADTEKEGFKFNARKAGQALALLREHEAETAQLDTESEQYAVQHAEQVAAQAEAEPLPIADHPHVRATLQRLSQHEAAMEGTRQHYETLATEIYNAAHANARAEFADIRTPADLQYLAQTDPARWGRFQQLDQNLLAAQNHIAQIGAHRAAQHKAQLKIYSAQQDTLFHNKHPELRNPATFMAAHTDTVEALTGHYGFTKAELADAWETVPQMHDARWQHVMLDAGKWRKAHENVRGGGRHPVPQVQRPGPARDRHVDYSEVQQLNRKFGDGPLSAQDAASLLVAQRKARAAR